MDLWILCIFCRLSDSHSTDICSYIHFDLAYTWKRMNDMRNTSKNGLIFNPFFLCSLFMEIYNQMKPFDYIRKMTDSIKNPLEIRHSNGWM